MYNYMLEIIIQKVEAILFTKAKCSLNNSEYVYLVYVYTFDMIVEKQLKHSISWEILFPNMLSLPFNLPQMRRAYFVSVWHSVL